MTHRIDDGEPLRVGYLIPEFPGQTHTFFWRERSALIKLGIHPELVSTRRARHGSSPHAWGAEAASATYYLTPPSPLRAIHSITMVLAAIFRADRGSLVRQFLAATMEGKLRSKPGRVLKQFAVLLAGADLATTATRRQWRHIHVHSCGDAAQVALYANLLSRVPYSLTLHGSLGDYGPNQEGKWRHASFAIVITHGLAASVQNSLGPSLPGVVEVAPMGVDTSLFARTAPYEPWVGVGPVRVFSCGRLNRSKGHADLIAAIALLTAEGVDAHLVIAGEDEEAGSGYHRELADLVQSLGLEAHITLLGAVSEGTIRDQLQVAHVFALASQAEPLGVAIMEAMSMGIPVVATSGGGVPELVEHMRTGVLVSPESPSDLRQAILAVLSDPELASSLAQAARDEAVARFDSRFGARTLARLLRLNTPANAAKTTPGSGPNGQDVLSTSKKGAAR